MSKDRYAAYYEVHCCRNGLDLNAGQRFDTEHGARIYAEQLLSVWRPVWITKTEPVDIFETDEDCK